MLVGFGLFIYEFIYFYFLFSYLVGAVIRVKQRVLLISEPIALVKLKLKKKGEQIF
jgi:hypothetical protein